MLRVPEREVGRLTSLERLHELARKLVHRFEDLSTVTSTGAANATTEDSRNAMGFGDLDVSISKGLLREHGWWPDLIAAVSWNADTGQTDNGVPLGTGFNEVGASLTASKSQEPMVFVGRVSYDHAFEEHSIQPGDALGFSLGTVLAASPETALSFFLDQHFFSKTEVNGNNVSGSDEVVSLFNIGASSILSQSVLLNAELGIGLTDSAPDYTVMVSLPISFELPFLGPARRR